MNSKDKKKLFEKILGFTTYEVDEFIKKKDSIEFKYVSIIKDIVCSCEMTTNSTKVYTDNLEKYFKQSEEIMVDLARVDSIRKYIDYHNSSNFYILFNDNRIEVTANNKISLNEITSRLDFVIIDLIRLWTNPDANECDCCSIIYPGLHNNMYYTPFHLMESRYIKYMGTSYKNRLYGNSLFSGYEDGDVIGDTEFIKIKDTNFVINLKNNASTNTSIIINKNVLIVLKEIKKIKLDIDITLVLKDNVMSIINKNRIDTSVIFLNNEKAIYSNEVDICKIIGDRILPYHTKPNPLDTKLLVQVIAG